MRPARTVFRSRPGALLPGVSFPVLLTIGEEGWYTLRLYSLVWRYLASLSVQPSAGIHWWALMYLLVATGVGLQEFFFVSGDFS
jgi:hypothetical protein